VDGVAVDVTPADVCAPHGSPPPLNPLSSFALTHRRYRRPPAPPPTHSARCIHKSTPPPRHLAVDGEQIKALYAQFLALKGVDEAASMADLTINFACVQGGSMRARPRACDRRRASLPTRSEFQAALGYKSKETSIFTERIFGLFDENKDGIM